MLTGIGIAAVVYWAPSLIAFLRRHRNRRALLALNTFAGWTIFGWITALVWSLYAEPSSYPRSERCSPFPELPKHGGS